MTFEIVTTCVLIITASVFLTFKFGKYVLKKSLEDFSKMKRWKFFLLNATITWGLFFSVNTLSETEFFKDFSEKTDNFFSQSSPYISFEKAFGTASFEDYYARF